VRGNQVDTAPKWQNYFRLQWQPTAELSLSSEIEQLGGYFLDAANSARYEGHTLLHLAVAWQPAQQWLLRMRVENLLNRRYAERADFAFGNFRYFPGQGTTLRLSLMYTDRQSG
jgi:iron complex outermembrane receptor protein